MTTHDDNTGWKPENPYAEEAKQRWGHTDAWKQSQERVKKMSKEDFAKIGEETDALMKRITAVSDRDPSDPEVLELIGEHYNSLRHFYEPNPKKYRGLADMYVADERFAAYYDKYKPGLAVFMRDAMHAYCDAQAKS
jgi:hypothetical protein